MNNLPEIQRGKVDLHIVSLVAPDHAGMAGVMRDADAPPATSVTKLHAEIDRSADVEEMQSILKMFIGSRRSNVTMPPRLQG